MPGIRSERASYFPHEEAFAVFSLGQRTLQRDTLAQAFRPQSHRSFPVRLIRIRGVLFGWSFRSMVGWSRNHSRTSRSTYFLFSRRSLGKRVPDQRDWSSQAFSSIFLPFHSTLLRAKTVSCSPPNLCSRLGSAHLRRLFILSPATFHRSRVNFFRISHSNFFDRCRFSNDSRPMLRFTRFFRAGFFDFP